MKKIILSVLALSFTATACAANKESEEIATSAPSVFFEQNFNSFKDLNTRNQISLRKRHFNDLSTQEKEIFVQNIKELNQIISDTHHVTEEIWNLEIKLALLSPIINDELGPDNYLEIYLNQVERIGKRHKNLIDFPFVDSVQIKDVTKGQTKEYFYQMPRLEIIYTLQKASFLAFSGQKESKNESSRKICKRINSDVIETVLFDRYTDLLQASRKHVSKQDFIPEIKMNIPLFIDNYEKSMASMALKFQKQCNQLRP